MSNNVEKVPFAFRSLSALLFLMSFMFSVAGYGIMFFDLKPLNAGNLFIASTIPAQIAMILLWRAWKPQAP